MARKLVGEDTNAQPEYGTQRAEPAPAKVTIEVPGKPGPHPAILPEDPGGDEVTIIIGAEKYAPVQYHSFDVGPFIVKTVRRPGESIAQVFARVKPQLQEMSEITYKESLARFLARVRDASNAARGGR